MSIIRSTFLLLFCAAFLQIQSQQQNNLSPATTGTLINRGCGTPPLPAQFENWVQGFSQPQQNQGKLGGGQTMSVFNIPVVVHIIHNNEPVNSVNATTGGNLNAAQIIDQINILNRDFNGLNSDTSNIPAVFKPLLGKFQFNFCLAVVNPTGGVMAEPGIDRINRVSKSWNAPPYSSAYVTNTIKPGSIWDPTKYLNMWVMNLSGGLLGFATWPNPGTSSLTGIPTNYGSLTTDGLVMRNSAFGSIGTAVNNTPYHLGRTAVHELGHWLGLRHIWGDATCGSDHCNDTPPAQNANYNCPTHPYKSGVCTGNTNGEMTMNYMDYTNDACMYMFSNDQKNRAQLIMTHSPLRSTLLTSTVCNTPTVTNEVGILYVQSPTYSQVINCNNTINPSVVMHNFGSNTITTATYSYNLNGVNTQTISWTGSLAPNSSATVNLPSITNLSNGSHQYNVGIYSPNGSTDPYLTNNTNNQQFSVSGSFTISTSGPSAVCAGETATFTAASTANSYTWNPGAVSGSVALFSPAASTIYTLAASNGSCVNTRTLAITVLPSPTVSVNSATICSGNAAVLNAGGACTYTWMPGTANTSSISVTPGSSTIYTLTASGCNGCSVTRNATVSVVSAPSLSVTIAPSGSLCPGGSATLTANGAASYSWQGGGNSNVLVVSPTITSTYSLGGSNGACSATTSAVVGVGNNSLVIGITPSPATVCAGNTLAITASGANTYSWSNGSNSPVLNLSPAANTTYTVSGTNGLCSATATVNVSVIAQPVVSLNASPGVSVCAGSQLQLSASGASSYSWSSGSTSQSIVVTPTSATVYSVTGFNQGCSTSQSIVTGISGSTLGLALSAQPGTVCSGGQSILSAAGISNYTWTGSGISGSAAVNPVSSSVYTLTGSDGPCPASATIAVLVQDAPALQLNADTLNICQGQSVLIGVAGPYTSINWMPGSSGGQSITVSPVSGTSYTVNATGAPGGCSASSVIVVNVASAPNAVLSTSNTPCDEPCTGIMNAVPVGGTAPYTFSISGSGCNSLPCVNLCPALYTLYITDAAGCKQVKYFSIECYSTVSATELDADSELSVYPNPAQSEIQVRASGLFGYSIYSELGQLLSQRNDCTNNEKIMINEFPKGIYLIQIRQHDKVLNRKFVKE